MAVAVAVVVGQRWIAILLRKPEERYLYSLRAAEVMGEAAVAVQMMSLQIEILPHSCPLPAVEAAVVPVEEAPTVTPTLQSPPLEA